MDGSKEILPNWPFRGLSMSSTSPLDSSSTSTGQPALPTEQTKLPVKQRVVFPSDRTNTSFGTYSDNMNNNTVNKISPTNYENKNNTVNKHNNIDEKQEFRDGWEFDSQHYRNPSPPIAERIGKNDNNHKRWQDYSNRYNDRRNHNSNYNNNQRGNGFNSYARSNNKFNGDNMLGKRKRNDSIETDNSFYIDWSDCNAATNRPFNMATAATQTSPKVQHQATQSDEDCNASNPGPKKTTKDAIMIDSWVKSLIGNSIFNPEKGQLNENAFSAGSKDPSHFKNDNSNQNRATIDAETQDYWAAEFKDKAQVSSPKIEKPSVFSRLGKPAICESNNFTVPRSNCQSVKPLDNEKNHSTTLFNETRVNQNLQKSQLQQEIPPSHPIIKPAKSPQAAVTSSQSLKPGEVNIRDPRIRKRLSIDTVAPESSLPKRKINEIQSLDSIPLIPLNPSKLVGEANPSCQKTHDKNTLLIDLS